MTPLRIAAISDIHFDGFGIDWGSAAAQAESNQRGDWADALRTGRIGRPGADR